MPDVMFDFYQITGTESSKHENFSSMCHHLLLRLFPAAKPVDGKGGDEGVDTIVGEFNGPCEIYQHKYFIEKVGPTQRRQTEASLRTAVNHHDVKKWTLMIPKDLNPSELKWFQKLALQYAPVSIQCWGKTHLQDLLIKYPDVAHQYQPSPIINILIGDKAFDLRTITAEKLATLLLGRSRPPASPSIGKDYLVEAAHDITKRSKLKLLIWGPGASGGAIYKKRCEIRDQLKRLGHQADFSETVWNPQKLRASGLNLSVAEYIQARAYDYIICIMASPGAIGEVHDFSKDKKLASKMMICVDDIHRSGYSALGALHIFEGLNGKLDWFENPIDIDKCYLSGRVLQQIQNVFEAKQWELVRGDNP